MSSAAFTRRKQAALDRLDRVLTRLEGGEPLKAALAHEGLSVSGWNDALRKSRIGRYPDWIWRRFETTEARSCDLCSGLVLKTLQCKSKEVLAGVLVEFYFCGKACFLEWVRDDPHTVELPPGWGEE